MQSTPPFLHALSGCTQTQLDFMFISESHQISEYLYVLFILHIVPSPCIKGYGGET